MKLISRVRSDTSDLKINDRQILLQTPAQFLNKCKNDAIISNLERPFIWSRNELINHESGI